MTELRSRRAARTPVLLAVTGLAWLLPMGGAGAARPDHAGQTPVIVVLANDADDPGRVSDDHRRAHGGKVTAVYEHALRGYAAELPAKALAAMARDPRVAYIEPDRLLRVVAVPTGVDRIEADKNPTADIDGTDERVNIDVAVLDTGIAAHRLLNVVGGARCTSLVGLFASCRDGNYADGHGHGTHVAGTVAAIDDGSPDGVVGVAPGARLWAVKVLDDAGSGYTSQIVKGIDWVTARASTIEVATMSLGGPGTSQAMSDAITRSTNAGLVYTVAAGNDGADAVGYTPANVARAITVSAMADFDGKAGGKSTATCRVDGDDTFADFSNYGAVVDVAAPGVCIKSTWLGGGYNTISGTSMSTPHVAGAAALYIVANSVPRNSSRWQVVTNGLKSSGWSVPQTNVCGFTQGRSAERMLLVGAPCDVAA